MKKTNTKKGATPKTMKELGVKDAARIKGGAIRISVDGESKDTIHK